jgi:hypothetical protein
MPVLRSLRVVALAATVVGALAACDSPSAPSAEPTHSPTPASGRCLGDELERSGISGRTVDADGNPVGDIFVLIDTGRGFRGDTRTAEDGVFFTTGVTGEFTISTVDIDYVSGPIQVTVACGETVSVEIVMTPVEE